LIRQGWPGKPIAIFGKSSGHPARLNFGDCFAYALAQTSHAPLLFKGSDFGHTDIASAVGT
jgi:ribonuclease VapC